MQLVGQDAKGKGCRGDCQNECRGSNAFDIAYTQMRHRRAHEVEDEADASRHSEERPLNTQNHPRHQQTRKLPEAESTSTARRRFRE